MVQFLSESRLNRFTRLCFVCECLLAGGVSGRVGIKKSEGERKVSRFEW